MNFHNNKSCAMKQPKLLYCYMAQVVEIGKIYCSPEMMDYLTLGSSGSDTLSGSVGCGGGGGGSGRGPSRVRTVRLVRPNINALPPPGLTCRHGPGLGFSIRGGREHGTGFFVSSVEAGSEAHRQGLRVGDQIIRVNGFTVEDAVHKEVLQLISNHTHLTLKVRSVGMIPVKDKSTDPLSWQIIPDYGHIISESPPLSEEKNHDVRINIAVAQRAKLGCGICKGPEWKPGIFVQFTKEGGIARDAGLRPGDQILYCNNIDFTDISFNEAVNVMKTARHLELVVRKGAGSELFPGESSGYNSSASSVTGDQSPSWSDSKRLSIVKEESLELEDRLSQLDFRYKTKSWEKLSYDWDEGPRHFRPTIINLSEHGTTINNNGTAEECQVEISPPVPPPKPSKPPADQQIVVEVHQHDESSSSSENGHQALRKSPSASSFTSSVSRASSATSASTTMSLSSAITMELQRRSERKKDVNTDQQLNIEEELQKNKILKGVDNDKKHQHEKLMDEFRRAHRKMFNSTTKNEENTAESDKTNSEKEQSVTDRLAAASVNKPQCTVTRRQSVPIPEDIPSDTQSRFKSRQQAPPKISATRRHTIDASPGIPPPPPPMPPLEPSTNSITTSKPPVKPPSTKPKAPPVPLKTSSLSQIPPCPTPDYDTLSVNSSVSNNNTLTRKVANGIIANGKYHDEVDMESLESYKLNNPLNMSPKPPNTYFNRQSSSPSSADSSKNSTLTKKSRPVSVTIGEYPSGASRKMPTKFDFLNGSDSEQSCDSERESITSRLASELAQTLSRSNLKKRTESMENMLNNVKPQTNGTVTISVNNNLNNNNKASFLSNNNNNTQHKVLTKSQSTNELANNRNNLDNLSAMLANRVTIKIADTDRKLEAPNGILKNGNSNHHCSAQHKPLVHQKSITFGEITTVINDRQMHVS